MGLREHLPVAGNAPRDRQVSVPPDDRLERELRRMALLQRRAVRARMRSVRRSGTVIQGLRPL